MSVYVIAQLEVHDMVEFEKYLAGFMPVFERHGGKLVGLSLEAEVIEGNWAMPRTVVMRFPTSEDARRWHNDPDYQTLAEHRHRASRANIVLIDGLD